MSCICQRVYDTGFTGIPRVDRRLAHQYNVYGEDCIRRAHQHANLHVPYTDTPRNPFCFVTGTKGHCAHDSCEHARYRPPDTVRKMRWYIEHQVCKAAVHYPDVGENDGPELATSGGIDYASAGTDEKWGLPIWDRVHGRRVHDEDGNYVGTLTGIRSRFIPPSDRAIEERERWEDEMHRLHRNLAFRDTEPDNVEVSEPVYEDERRTGYRKVKRAPLRAISPDQFREELTTALTGITLDAGLLAAEVVEELGTDLTYWNDAMTPEEEEAYWLAEAI
jgi:hypothetical protein